MRKFFSILILSLIAVSTATDGNACGDKTLRVARGIRFHRVFAARNPSSILIHTAAIPKGQASELKVALAKIGHKPQVVDEMTQLSEAVKSGQYDLVLIDLGDAANLTAQLASSSSRTVVVPVVYKRSKAEEKAAHNQYTVIVKNPIDETDFMAAVYNVMRSKNHKQNQKS